jgi:O-antigen ligase
VKVRRGWLGMIAVAAIAPLVFQALPASLQLRFETILNSDVGPENAKQSGEGRIEGLFKGLDLWMANPLTGVGPGAWRPATRSRIESHNLYGQIAGETGTLGLVAFVFLIACFWRNSRRVRQLARRNDIDPNSFLVQVSSAVATSVFLLLFMGNFGHNLFRFSWLWYGGFLIIANHCLSQQLRTVTADEPIEDEWELREETRELLGSTA